MNPERPNEDPEAVRRVLREWKVTSQLPPRFVEDVWRRIEKAEPAAPPASIPTLWAVLRIRVAAMLPRPAFAISYVSVLLLAGLFAGYWHARIETTSWDKALASRYVEAVDPFRKSIGN
jgi:hypothetical protein